MVQISIFPELNELKEQVRERLNSELGKTHRSKRPIEVEAVFGQMKSNNKYTRFTLRGLDKVNIEFGLMALAHNLRKLAKAAQQAGNHDLQVLLQTLSLSIFAYLQNRKPLSQKIEFKIPNFKTAV